MDLTFCSNVKHVNEKEILSSATFILLTPGIANMLQARCETPRCQQPAKRYD